ASDTSTSLNLNSSTFGQISSTSVNARLIQFALRITFKVGQVPDLPSRPQGRLISGEPVHQDSKSQPPRSSPRVRPEPGPSAHAPLPARLDRPPHRRSCLSPA